MANPNLLPPPPVREPMTGRDGLVNPVWMTWFTQFYSRVGGAISFSPVDNSVLEACETPVTVRQPQDEGAAFDVPPRRAAQDDSAAFDPPQRRATQDEELAWLGVRQRIPPPGCVPLFDHYTDVGNSGTGETDLYSDTTAAGQLADNGDKLSAEYGGTFVSSGTATREIKIYFGGTAIFDTGALTLSLSSAWTAYADIIRVSATVVRYMISLATEGAALSAYTAVGELTGLTLANTNILKITGQAAGVGAASSDIVAKMGSVEYRPNA